MINLSEFRPGRRGVVVALVYPVLGLLLWYSLAAHLRLGLGRWPESIGIEPGTPFFRAHAGVMRWLIIIGFFSTMVAGVVGGVLVVIPRTRKLSVYPLAFAGGCLVAFGLMHLAPHSFINWFLD